MRLFTLFATCMLLSIGLSACRVTVGDAPTPPTRDSPDITAFTIDDKTVSSDKSTLYKLYQAQTVLMEIRYRSKSPISYTKLTVTHSNQSSNDTPIKLDFSCEDTTCTYNWNLANVPTGVYHLQIEAANGDVQVKPNPYIDAIIILE